MGFVDKAPKEEKGMKRADNWQGGQNAVRPPSEYAVPLSSNKTVTVREFSNDPLKFLDTHHVLDLRNLELRQNAAH